MANVGTAYVQVRGDLSHLNKQLVANLSPAKLRKFGLIAGGALGAGLVAGGIGKGLFDVGKQFDSSFDLIRTSTGKTGKSLKGLEGDFKDVVKAVPANFDDAGKAVAGLSQRLGVTGKPLQNLAKQILELSRITKTDVGENVAAVTRLFGDWSVKTKNQAGQLDKLFRISQKTGIGVGDLARFMVQFGSPLRQLGFGFDEAAVMFGKFEKEGVNLQTIMPGFRFALKNLSHPTGEAADALKKLGINAKEPRVALRQVFDAIKKAPTDLKANAIAFAIFGRRAGPDMAAAIREGRFAYGDLIKDVNKGRDTIQGAAKDTNDFSENWQLLKNRVFVAIEPIASKFFKTISAGMAELATADFQSIGDNLDKSLGLGKIDLGPLGAQLKESVRTIQEILNSGLVRFMSGTVLASVRRSIQGVAQSLKGLATIIAGTLGLINDLLHLRFAKAWKDVEQIFRGGVQFTIGIFRQLSGPLREVAARAGTAIASPFRGAWNRIKDIFSSGVSGALSVLRGMAGVVASIGARIGNVLRRSIEIRVAAVGGAFRLLRRVAEGSFGGIRSAIGWVVDKVHDLLNLIPKIHFPKIKVPGIGGGAIGGVVGKSKNLPTSVAIVGEQGPELVTLPVGSRVHAHPESQRMAKQMGIPGFASGGLVRAISPRKRKEDEYDPTAKQGQPDRESGSGSRAGLRRAPSAQAASGGGIPAGIVGRANRLDNLHLPYVWGGGHGSVAQALKNGFDCSGAVSYVLGIPGRFSGDFGFWGKPGPGIVSTYSNAKHVVMSVAGQLFGTGDGTGPHWLGGGPGARFSAPYATRHIGKAGTSFSGEQVKDRVKPKITGKLSLGQIVTLAKQVGFSDPALAASVAYAESKGDINAKHGNADGSEDLGLFQINHKAHPKYDVEKLTTDIFYNARAAKDISGGGKNWKPWTTYRSGAYKDFLGGKAERLPKGQPVQQGSSYADFIQFKIDLAEFHKQVPTELRWIAEGLSYWRKVMRRNSPGSERSTTALSNIKTLVEQRKGLRKTPAAAAYELTPLGKQIGTGGQVFSIQNLQGVLDSNEHDSALAALTETYDSLGNVLPSSFTDDLAAGNKLTGIWDYLFGLTTGKQSLPGQGHWENAPGEQPVDKLGHPTTAAKAKAWKHADGTFSKAPKQVSVAGKPVPIMGTLKQQTYAAQQLQSAREAFKSIQDEMKTEDISAIADTTNPKADFQDFTAAIRALFQQFGSNVGGRNLPSFATGGMFKAPWALVGEKGPEIVRMPVGTQVFSNAQSERMAQGIIPSFADGGVLKAAVPTSSRGSDNTEALLKELIRKVGERQPVVKNIDARHEFKEVPKEPHAWSRQVLYELESA